MNISVNGPKIFYTIPILGGINITETTVNMWIVMAFLTAFILWLTHGMTVHATGKRQLLAEKLVLMTQSFCWIFQEIYRTDRCYDAYEHNKRICNACFNVFACVR